MPTRLNYLSPELPLRSSQLAGAIAEQLQALGVSIELPNVSPDPSVNTATHLEAVAKALGVLPANEPMTVVTKTVGILAEEDYTTWTAWEADLDNSGIYSSADDAVGEGSNHAFSERLVINGGSTIGLNSITVRPASGSEHDGTPGTGCRIVEPSVVVSFGNALYVNTSVATVNINDMEVDGNALRGFSISHQLAGASTQTNYVRRNLWYNADNATNTSETGVYYGTSYNNEIMDTMIFRISADAGAEIYGIRHTGSTAREDRFNNVTVHGLVQNSATANAYGVDVVDDADFTYKNMSVTSVTGSSSGTKSCFNNSSPSSAACSNNLTSDATAPGSSPQTNKSAANQYVSTTIGSEDLHLKSGADCIGNGVDLGTSPSGVELDIDSYDRDAAAVTWDIGADQFVAVGGSTPVNLMMLLGVS